MASRKPKDAGTENYTLTMTSRLARRLDKELENARRLAPDLVISRSAFYAHVMAEWLAILRHPEREPALPVVRRRTRPKVRRANPNGKRLTPEEVRQIREDRRPFVDIARDLGVHKSTVGRVRNGQTWASVT